MFVIAQVEKFFASLLADRQPVCSAFELSAPGANEFPILIEHNHRVLAVAVRSDDVVYVDVPL